MIMCAELVEPASMPPCSYNSVNDFLLLRAGRGRVARAVLSRNV